METPMQGQVGTLEVSVGTYQWNDESVNFD
jgi:hypothetical protein